MRTITDHKVNGLNEAIDVVASDDAGAGGANHKYQFTAVGCPMQDSKLGSVNFQDGTVTESGINGITNEALLAVLIDRMRGFQHQRHLDGSFDFNSRGPFACRDNAIVLTLFEDALMRLQKRLRDRMARGVEGTHTA